MTLTPVISKEIFDRHPDFHFASIVVKNAAIADPENETLAQLLAEAEASVQTPNPVRDAHLAAWNEAYRTFGAKPKRTPPSAAALIKRVAKDGALPRISPLVDAYNAISVLYGIPVGGEDLALYRGLPHLTLASGDEPFETTRDAAPVTEYPEPGEIIWRDDLGVTCRRWNWRQGPRTAVSANSRDLWLVLEALGPMQHEALAEAAERLVDAIRATCPDAEIELEYLDKDTADQSST